MPNIEIHGLVAGNHWSDAVKMRREIFQLLSNKSYAQEVIVTVFRDVVSDQKGSDRPYLRIVTTDVPFIGELVVLLQELNIDIELQKLIGFYPKESSTKD